MEEENDKSLNTVELINKEKYVINDCQNEEPKTNHIKKDKIIIVIIIIILFIIAISFICFILIKNIKDNKNKIEEESVIPKTFTKEEIEIA